MLSINIDTLFGELFLNTRFYHIALFIGLVSSAKACDLDQARVAFLKQISASKTEEVKAIDSPAMPDGYWHIEFVGEKVSAIDLYFGVDLFFTDRRYILLKSGDLAIKTYYGSSDRINGTSQLYLFCKNQKLQAYPKLSKELRAAHIQDANAFKADFFNSPEIAKYVLQMRLGSN